ncbi:MAG: helix-turn-helix domain-containing protein [Ruminococcaceae bacterium]|nr:helix-turn-helix domain-containing protein [Oscillospiraceae bacterium]
MRLFGKESFVDSAELIYIKKEAFSRSQEIHLHDFVEVVFITNGKGVHRIDNKEYSVSRGDLIFINYHQTHSFEVNTKMDFYNLFLSPDFFDEALRDSRNIFDILTLTAFAEFRSGLMPDRSFLRFHGDDLLEVERLFEVLLREQTEKRDGYKTMMRMQGVSLFVHIFRKMLESIETETNESISIDEITRYVEANCTDKLTLKDLAQKCFYNPSYFSRVFKKKNGMSLIEFIHKNRIKKACELLRASHLTVEEIAIEVGYQDRSGFYTQFKKFMGCLPTEYKEK